MDRRDVDDGTNAADRKQPLKTTASMPILGQRAAADNGENRRERRRRGDTDVAATAAALPDSGDDDDVPRPGLTKSTSCYYVQQTGEQQPTSDKPSRGADDKI